MSFANPQYLVETGWLAEHLQDADLRILDCTTVRYLDQGSGLRVESGRENWAREHIPGSEFADLVLDLSDRNSPLRFMMPPAAQFAEAMSSYGVGPGTRVVLYDSEIGSWAARVWWMLRAFGFDDASVLNGGLSQVETGGEAGIYGAAAVPPGLVHGPSPPGFDCRQRRGAGGYRPGGYLHPQRPRRGAAPGHGGRKLWAVGAHSLQCQRARQGGCGLRYQRLPPCRNVKAAVRGRGSHRCRPGYYLLRRWDCSE